MHGLDPLEGKPRASHQSVKRRDGEGVGPAGLRVSDLGREELDEALLRPRSRGLDERGQRDGVDGGDLRRRRTERAPASPTPPSCLLRCDVPAGREPASASRRPLRPLPLRNQRLADSRLRPSRFGPPLIQETP